MQEIEITLEQLLESRDKRAEFQSSCSAATARRWSPLR